MSTLQIVATITVKSAHKDELMGVLKTLVAETRKEPGNLSYNLFEDVKNPLKFIILEAWKSQDAIDTHNATPHFKAFVAAIDGKVDGVAIDVIKQMDV